MLCPGAFLLECDPAAQQRGIERPLDGQPRRRMWVPDELTASILDQPQLSRRACTNLSGRALKKASRMHTFRQKHKTDHKSSVPLYVLDMPACLNTDDKPITIAKITLVASTCNMKHHQQQQHHRQNHNQRRGLHVQASLSSSSSSSSSPHERHHQRHHHTIEGLCAAH